MPKVLQRSSKPTAQKAKPQGTSNVLNMMGYGGEDSDGDNSAFEQELAEIMGGQTNKKAKKAPPKKLVDWSVLDAQVKESLRDVDEEEGDVEVTSDDEMDLMGELQDIVGEDESKETSEASTLTVAQQPQARTPSPAPVKASTDILTVLQARKEMYETGIKQSTMSSKTRRLQRGLKQIEDMMKQAKRGKNISEDSIPPQIAIQGGAPVQQQAPAQNPAPQTPPTQKTAPQMAPAPSVQLQPVVLAPTQPQTPAPAPAVEPTAITPPALQPAQTSESPKCSLSPDELRMFEARKDEYKAAAMKAKHENDRDTAVKCFQTFKQIDFVINAAKEGKKVEVSQLPPSPSQALIEAAKPQASSSSVEQAGVQKAAAQAPQKAQPADTTAPEQPKTTLDHLRARADVYKKSAEEAEKEGNSSKSRRMMRIVKQYQSAVRQHQAGKRVNFDELPSPPGFPPIPGQAAQPQVNVMERAAQLANQDPDAEDNQSSAAPAQRNPQQQQAVSSRREPPTTSTAKPQSAFNAQIDFLTTRQALFRKAALEARNEGNREVALQHLKHMKSFDQLIKLAKQGIKVDISKVPQPPIMSSEEPGVAERRGSEGKKEFGTLEAKNDGEMYARMIAMLTKQVKKARRYGEQMTMARDVRAAQMCDQLAASSQADLDYIVSCRRHNDPPPRFYYVDKELKVMEMNTDIGENEVDLKIVQCTGVGGVVKDNKTYVEWEMPWPHDNPIKGHTDEVKPSPKPMFEQSFRVEFVRKQKSNQRAIKHKSIKLSLVAKGGFMRSARVLGSCNVKLAPLDECCRLHVVEKLKEGRNEVGEIEVQIGVRTPISGGEAKSVVEKWMCVEQRPPPPQKQAAPQTHKKKSVSSRPAHSNTSSSSSSSSSKNSAKNVNISSIQASLIDYKLLVAQMEQHKQRGANIPRDMMSDARSIRAQIDETKRYLQEGGAEARREYYNCLTQQYQFLAHQSQQYEKNNQPGKSRVSRKKKEAVGLEIQKYKS